MIRKCRTLADPVDFLRALDQAQAAETASDIDHLEPRQIALPCEIGLHRNITDIA
jgi:hypothetical protein